MDADSLPIWIDVFAMSINGLFGAALARSGRMPVAATLVSGLIIGLGGGITRDVLLGLEPTMISDWAYVPAVLAASVVGGLTGRFFASRDGYLVALQGVCVGLLITVGVQKGLDYEVPIPSAILLGVVTATAGRLIFDAVARGRSPMFGQGRMYLSILITSSLVFWAGSELIGFYFAVLIAVAVTVAMTLAGQSRGWRSPEWPGDRDRGGGGEGVGR